MDPVTPKNLLFNLPDRVVAGIFDYEGRSRIPQLSLVCKRFHEIINATERFWKPIILPTQIPESWQQFAKRRNDVRARLVMGCHKRETLDPITRSAWGFPLSLSPQCVLLRKNHTSLTIVFSEPSCDQVELSKAIASYPTETCWPWDRQDAFSAGTEGAVYINGDYRRVAKHYEGRPHERMSLEESELATLSHDSKRVYVVSSGGVHSKLSLKWYDLCSWSGNGDPVKSIEVNADPECTPTSLTANDHVVLVLNSITVLVYDQDLTSQSLCYQYSQPIHSARLWNDFLFTQSNIHGTGCLHCYDRLYKHTVGVSMVDDFNLYEGGILIVTNRQETAHYMAQIRLNG